MVLPAVFDWASPGESFSASREKVEAFIYYEYDDGIWAKMEEEG